MVTGVQTCALPIYEETVVKSRAMITALLEAEKRLPTALTVGGPW